MDLKISNANVEPKLHEMVITKSWSINFVKSYSNFFRSRFRNFKFSSIISNLLQKYSTILIIGLLVFTEFAPFRGCLNGQYLVVFDHHLAKTNYVRASICREIFLFLS